MFDFTIREIFTFLVDRVDTQGKILYLKIDGEVQRIEVTTDSKIFYKISVNNEIWPQREQVHLPSFYDRKKILLIRIWQLKRCVAKYWKQASWKWSNWNINKPADHATPPVVFVLVFYIFIFSLHISFLCFHFFTINVGVACCQPEFLVCVFVCF